MPLLHNHSLIDSAPLIRPPWAMLQREVNALSAGLPRVPWLTLSCYESPLPDKRRKFLSGRMLRGGVCSNQEYQYGPADERTGLQRDRPGTRDRVGGSKQA